MLRLLLTPRFPVDQQELERLAEIKRRLEDENCRVFMKPVLVETEAEGEDQDP